MTIVDITCNRPSWLFVIVTHFEWAPGLARAYSRSSTVPKIKYKIDTNLSICRFYRKHCPSSWVSSRVIRLPFPPTSLHRHLSANRVISSQPVRDNAINCSSLNDRILDRFQNIRNGNSKVQHLVLNADFAISKLSDFNCASENTYKTRAYWYPKVN